MKFFPLARQAVVGCFFPPLCELCERSLSVRRQLGMPFLCEDCEGQLTPIGEKHCPRCGHVYETEFQQHSMCANCGDQEIQFDFAVSACRNEGAARQLMHSFKYGGSRYLSRPFGILLEAVWRDSRLRRQSWTVVPVPLHPKRIRERGFNQAEDLARELVKRAPGDVEARLSPLLKRVRHTVRQARLDRADRLTNLQGVFATTRRAAKLSGEPLNFLLVDDVMTTGATASECARVLRQSLEVDQIAAVSLLRG